MRAVGVEVRESGFWWAERCGAGRAAKRWDMGHAAVDGEICAR